MSEADKKLSPWHPTTNKVTLKIVLKLIEELGELISAAARSLMQGIDESEPVTGKPNRQWLEEEIADVGAGISLTVEHFDLDTSKMTERARTKQIRLKEWHDML